MYKNQKGLTLIALIIIIVVILLFALVAIGATNSDGLITKSPKSKNKYEDAQYKETIKQSEQYALIECYKVKSKNGTIYDYLYVDDDNINIAKHYDDNNLLTKGDVYIAHDTLVDGKEHIKLLHIYIYYPEHYEFYNGPKGWAWYKDGEVYTGKCPISFDDFEIINDMNYLAKIIKSFNF